MILCHPTYKTPTSNQTVDAHSIAKNIQSLQQAVSCHRLPGKRPCHKDDISVYHSLSDVFMGEGFKSRETLHSVFYPMSEIVCLSIVRK